MSIAIQVPPENEILPITKATIGPFQPLSLDERESYEHRIADLQRNLAEMVRAQNEWIQLAAHELRTPLTSLQLNLEVGVRRAVTSPALPFLEHAREDSLRVIRLMDHLWKACEGKDPLAVNTIEQADLRKIVKRALRQVQTRHADARFHVEEIHHANTNAPSAPANANWTLTTDPIRLEQVMINLAENAWKYGKGKPVCVKLDILTPSENSPVRPSYKVAFCDQGDGVAEDQLDHLCQPRQRLEQHQKIEGTGWGLYVVRRIADALGATIQVRSQKEKGTCFEVQIPSSMLSKN